MRRLQLWLLNCGVSVLVLAGSSALGAVAILARIMERRDERRWRRLARKSWLDD